MFDTTHPNIDRRSLIVGALSSAAILSVFPTRIFAQEGGTESGAEPNSDKLQRRERFEELGFMWQATSPSTHEGDTLTAVFTNKGSSALTIWPSIIIMDHMNHHNESVVDEEFELPAGQSRTFSAVNDYGIANHFSTRMLAATGDPAVLGIEISIVDASGSQTAQFNERALWVKSFDEVKAIREEQMPAESEAGGHDHTT